MAHDAESAERHHWVANYTGLNPVAGMVEFYAEKQNYYRESKARGHRPLQQEKYSENSRPVVESVSGIIPTGRS